MRRRLAPAALAVGLVVLAATYAGALHPAGDSLGVGRPFLAALLVVAGLVIRGGMGWAAVAGGLLALAPVLWAMRPIEAPGQGIIVYQKNLLYSVDDPSEIAADIRDSGADVALLQELSAQNGALRKMLAEVLPHQGVCPSNTPGTHRAGPLRPSFSLLGLPITIDHVLAPEGWTAVTAMRPRLGSDHRGQRAVLAP